MDDAFVTLARLPATYRPLPPPVAAAFSRAAGKVADAFNAQPSDKAIFDFLCLPKVGLAPGQNPDSTHRLSKYPDINFPELPAFAANSFRSGGTSSVVKQVELGRLGNASRMLDGDGEVAGYSEEVLEALKEKHPEGEANPFGNTVGPVPTNRPPTIDVISDALYNFRNDTAPGISGWTVPLLKVAIRSDSVKDMLTTLVGMLLAGTAPGRRFLCSSRLIALDKPDNGVRPIAVGELLYRLCTKAILRSTFTPDSLSPCQFGVGTRGGIEPVIRAVQRAMDDTVQDESFSHITSLDFKNAFNTLSRSDMAKAVKKYAPGLYRAAKWAYNDSSDLIFGGIQGAPAVIKSSQGVRQGDPLGPLLFSIGIRDILDRLSATLNHDAVVLAYLDDVYVLSNSYDTQGEVFDFFGAGNNHTSLELNILKTSIVSFDEIRVTGLPILGSCVGPVAARRTFLEEKVTKLEEKMEKLVGMPHQHSLLLLRQCIQQELRHLQRCLVTDDLVDVWKRLDRSVWKAALRLRSSRTEEGIEEQAEPNQITDTLLSLPVRLGGLGLLSHETCAPLAFAAASEVADRILEPLIGPPVSPPKLTDPADPDSIARQKVRCNAIFDKTRETLFTNLNDQQIKQVLESASGFGKRWLSVVPFYQALRLTDFEISAGLHFKTLEVGPVCPLCSQPNFAGHAEVCTRRKRWNIARHEQVKRAIGAALSKVEGARVIVEPHIGETDRRNDIRFTGTEACGIAKHEYDVTVVSLSTRDSMATHFPPNLSPTNPAERCHGLIGQFLTKVANNKIRRLPANANNIPFTPLVFTIGGMMDEGTVNCLKLWKDMIPASAFTTLCQQLSLILLRARAKSFEL
jgi:hypothetical protein